MNRICLICEKEFHVKPAVIKKGHGLYCSWSCKNKAFKGKHLSPSTEIKKGQHIAPETEFKKGMTTWNKGIKIDKNKYPNLGHHKPHSQETKERIRLYNKQHNIKPRGIFRAVGEKNYNWKGGITPLTRIQRTKFTKQISQQVLKRDDYTCQLCGIRGVYMHVDHIQSWSEYIDLRFSINNCRTLCRECHYQITFGKPMPKDSKWGIYADR